METVVSKELRCHYDPYNDEGHYRDPDDRLKPRLAHHDLALLEPAWRTKVSLVVEELPEQSSWKEKACENEQVKVHVLEVLYFITLKVLLSWKWWGSLGLGGR
jgi:hypothetical protein